MRTIGLFSEDGDDYVGRIEILSFQHRAAIVATHGGDDEGTPEYWVFAKAVKLGEANKSLDEHGKYCLAVMLDDPCFTQPVRCLLLDDGYGDHRLVWKR